jgi:hypothetical protein
MPRFMVHLRNSSYSPKDATELLHRARSLIGQRGLVVRDARVSRKHIEFDLTVPEGFDVNAVVGRLGLIAPADSIEEVVERHLSKEDAIRLAVRSFNEEKFWNAHEILEGVWKETRGNEKVVLNGIILVAAAFVHDEKDESSICLSILRRALAKLESWEGLYFGIDIDRMANHVRRIIDSGKIVRFSIWRVRPTG